MTSDKELPRAQITPLKTISKIWIVPIVAIFIGAWMLYIHISNKGPLVEIRFETGEGIEAGRTKIKINNVEVGKVESLILNSDAEGVMVTARIRKQNSHLLRQDTQFWVVRPRIGKGGVSGLGTLFSGAYIELSPGLSDKTKIEFVGLETEPVTPSGTPGLHITLNTGGYKAFDVGDPILFHGIEVGRIEHVYFNTEERVVYYDAFVEHPHDGLVTKNTKFWEVNGVEVDLSADGIRVQSGTLETMISGGVTFDVPEDMPRGERVTEREYFTVFPNKEAIYENRFKHAFRLILLFKGSIRGLKPGAPVEYKGIKVGKVIRMDTDYPEITRVLDRDSLIPVMISIEPARVGFTDDDGDVPMVEQYIEELIANGLQGGLATGNLLTGSKYVELDYAENVVVAKKRFSNHLVMPTFDSQFDHIIKQVSKMMDKLNHLPLETVVVSAGNTLQQASETLKEFKSSAEHLSVLIKQSTDEQLVVSIKNALDNFKKLSSDFSEGSITHGELQGTLSNMKQALAELEPLLEQLNRKPSSFIFGSNKSKDIEPKGAVQ